MQQATESTTAAAGGPPKQTQQKSVADLLKSAATKKPSSKAPSGYLYDGDPIPAANTLVKCRIANESKAEYELSKDRLRELVDPWYANQVRRYGYQATVRFICGVNEDGSTNECRLAYQHRYSKVPLANEDGLRAIVGRLFDDFFQKQSGLKIRKEVADNPERLAVAVAAMMDGTVAEHFAEWFEYEEFLYPSRAWTERHYLDLSDEQIAACERLGVRQVVSFTDATKDE